MTSVLVSGVVSGVFCIPISHRPTPGTLGWWETLNCSGLQLRWTGDSSNAWLALRGGLKKTCILITEGKNISGLQGIIWNMRELLCGAAVDGSSLSMLHIQSYTRCQVAKWHHWVLNETPLLYYWEHILQQAQPSVNYCLVENSECSFRAWLLCLMLSMDVWLKWPYTEGNGLLLTVK